MSREVPVVLLGPRLNTEPGPLIAETYAKHGAVFRAARLPVFFFAGPEANRFVFGTGRHHFSIREGWQRAMRATEVFGEGLAFSDGPRHDLHRRLMNPPFKIHRVEEWMPIVDRVVTEGIADWGERGEIDLFGATYRMMFAIAAEAFLGVKDREAIGELSHSYQEIESAAIQPMADAERYAIEQRLKARCAAIIQPLIDERRDRPPEDVLGLLASARDDKGFLVDDEAVMAEATVLLLAGHITTASFASWLFYLLGKYPEWQERCSKDESALDRAMLETERLYPPLAYVPRVTAEEFEFVGYRIPKGAVVACSIAGSHWIPEVFRDPAKFDPDRFAPPREEHLKTPFSLVGFAGGPRMCLGVHFARMEMAAMARHVLRRYRLSLVPGFEVRQQYRPIGTPVPGMRMRVEEFTRIP